MCSGGITTGWGAMRVSGAQAAAGRVLEGAVYALISALFIYLSADMLWTLASSWGAAIRAAAVLAALAACVCALVRQRALARAQVRALFAAILALAALARAAYVFAVPTQPVSDFLLLYDTALAAAGGDFSWAAVTQGYFGWWRYQIPFVMYEALILRIVPSMAALKLMNVLWGVGIVALIYIIAREFVPAGCALAAAFLYAIHPGQIELTSVLTNQHVSMFFILLGAAALLRARSIWGCAAAGLALALGNLMRPEAGIALAALICVGLCRFASAPSKRRLVQLALCALAVLGAYYLAQRAVELILIAADAAPYGVANAVPEWKIVVGLNTRTGGTVTNADEHIFAIVDRGERIKETLSIARAYLAECESPLVFFTGKLKYFWASADDVSFTLGGLSPWDTAFAGISMERLMALMGTLELSERFALYALAAVGAVRGLWQVIRGRGAPSAGALWMAIILLGTVAAYLIVEIQPRYRYFAIPFVALVAAQGLCTFKGTK